MPALRISVGLVVNPWIAGLAAISLIPERSAPSANSFTLSWAVSVIVRSILSGASCQDSTACLGERFYSHIGRLGAFSDVPVIDEEIGASRCLAGRHVPPPVAHHEALPEVDAEFTGGLQEHSRLGLAAMAAVGIRVKADSCGIQGQIEPQAPVHRLDDLDSLLAGRHVRLVRHDDVQKARASQ